MSNGYSSRGSAIASSAIVKTGPGIVTGIILTAGADTATVTIYDNTAGSGTVLAKLSAVTNTTAAVSLAHPLSFGKGIYATITGTTPSITIMYV